MDYKHLYSGLTQQLGKEIPITASPIRELVSIFREGGHPITLKTRLTITSVFNSGDISGIMCTVTANDGHAIACALTHLILEPLSPLYTDIIEYQKRRFKRIEQLNRIGKPWTGL